MAYQEKIPMDENMKSARNIKPEYTGSVMSGEIDQETGRVLTKEEVEVRKKEREGETLH
jgi:hypothetical protein